MRGNAVVSYVAVTTTDEGYGDATPTTADPVAVPGAVWAPRTSAESSDRRTPAVITGGTLYRIPTTLGVSPLDRFVVDGLTYEVEGEPGRWVSPATGRSPGLEVAVKRWEQP